MINSGYSSIAKDECSICMGLLREPAESWNSESEVYKGVVITRCKHVAHLNCINKWLAPRSIEDRACVMCKGPALPLSKNLVYGDCSDIQDFLETTPLSVCNPGSIETLRESLQGNPDLARRTFLSKEFGPDISLLMFAALKGYIDIVQLLIRAGADVNQCHNQYQTPLFQAVKLNNCTLGRELIASGACVDLQYSNDGIELIEAAIETGHHYAIEGIKEDDSNYHYLRSFLTDAIEKNDCLAVDRLIKKGVDLNKALEDGNTFLHLAVRGRKSKQTVLALARKMTRFDAVDSAGYTALTLAANMKNLVVVKCLLSLSRNSFIQPEALIFTAQNGDKDMMKCLLSGREYCSDYLNKALHAAVLVGHENLIKMLCDKGGDVNYIAPESGQSLLHKAIDSGKTEVVEALCQNGADVMLLPPHKQTPLLYAAFNERLGMAEVLIKYGADVNLGQYNNSSLTPLLIACQNRDLELANLLIENKARVSSPPGKTADPLYISAQEGYDEIVRILLDNGAEIDAQRNEHATALIVAAYCGHAGTIKLLLDNGADSSIKKANGDTALHTACRRGHTDVVKLLIEKGANYGIRNGSGYTTLDIARLKRHKEVINLLTPDTN